MQPLHQGHRVLDPVVGKALSAGAAVVGRTQR